MVTPSLFSVSAVMLFLSTWIIIFPLVTSVPSQSLTEATQVLSNSGFVSMSLTLRLLSKPLGLSSSRYPSLTVFSPSDYSFALSSQPSLSLLRVHFVPLSLPFDIFRSLPFATKIPTMDPNVSLTVTTAFTGDYSFKIRLNEVEVIGSPVFDDGFLTIYGIEDFLDPNFNVPPLAPAQSPTARSERCTVNVDASNGDLLRQGRKRGHSLVGSILDLQNGVLMDHKITVFVPSDDALVNLTGKVGKIGSIFLRHILPCRISGKDLGDFSNGTVIGTSLEGSSMEVTVSGDGKDLMVNGVIVNALDMWENEGISIHGLSGVLA